MQFRLLAIVAATIFGLTSIALAIVGFLVALADSGAGCPGCSHTGEGSSNAVLYLLAAGGCFVAGIVSVVLMRRSGPSPASEPPPKTNTLGLRP